MFGLSLIDLIVIGLYFGGMIAIGFWAMRRIKNQEDYFLAGRRFGKFVQTFAAFGQGTSADTCVSVTTTTFTNGAPGIWSSLLWLFATPFYWIVSPWMRRLRLLTLGDFFEERYGSKPMAATYALIGSMGAMAVLAVGFSAMTKTVVGLTPKTYDQMTIAQQTEYKQAEELQQLKTADYASLTQTQKNRLAELIQLKPKKIHSHISETILIWLVCAVVMLYAVTGGLEAAFITDTVQGIFIILLSIILFPFGWSKINAMYGSKGVLGAFDIIHTQLPESFFEIFGSPTAADFTWYYIIAVSVMSIINVVIQPNMIVATGSAKDEYAARFGFTVGCFIKRVCTIGWAVFALGAIVLYYKEVNDPDLVWGYATLDLLKPLNIGLVGLMIACLMAALMSTADCQMITCASLLTHNIYRPLVLGKTETHYVWAGRILGAMVLIGGGLIATQFDSILQLLKLWWEINVIVGASFWLGMKWRRANRKSAWCSISITAILFFVIPIGLPALMPSLRTNEALLAKTQIRTETREYTAREMDIETRDKEIAQWQKLSDEAKLQTEKPQALEIGQCFTKEYVIPQNAIYWTKGVKVDANGNEFGSGFLNLELILLDKMGFNLSKNPYALNETIRVLIRTIVPFVILIVVALVTKPDDKARLDRFYVKMRTPTLPDHDKDAEELALSMADTDRYSDKKLFPHSNWEIYKWNGQDWGGFLLSCGGVVVVLVLLKVLISIGA